MTWHHNQLAKINIFLQLSQKKIKVFFIKILTKNRYSTLHIAAINFFV